MLGVSPRTAIRMQCPCSVSVPGLPSGCNVHALCQSQDCHQAHVHALCQSQDCHQARPCTMLVPGLPSGASMHYASPGTAIGMSMHYASPGKLREPVKACPPLIHLYDKLSECECGYTQTHTCHPFARCECMPTHMHSAYTHAHMQRHTYMHTHTLSCTRGVIKWDFQKI